MHRTLCWLLMSLVAVAVLAGEAHADAVARLKSKVSRVVNGDPALASARIGVYIKVNGTNRVIYAKNADVPMVPASNFKVLTTATALIYLGKDFRFTTEVLGPPPDAETGVVSGDVYLKGNGDPTMVEPFTRPALGPFFDFADLMWKRGVRRINGAVVGDDSAFDRDFLGKGWRKHYLLLDYAPETGALSINGNVMHLEVKPDRVQAWPPTSTVRYKRVSSRGTPSVFRRFNSSEVIISNLKGALNTSMTLHNPPLYTTSTFMSVLKDRGIKIAGGARLVNPSEVPLKRGLIQYGVHQSAPLLTILKQINKESDNLFAQHVFKAIGWKMYGQGTHANASRAIVEFMASQGVDVRGLQVADGCGLSVLNRVTPRQLTELLEAMARRTDFPVWKSTLSQGGKDGTLSYRLNGCNVYGKTGTINGACTLSGYVTTKAGQQVSFAILVNHHRTSNDHVRWYQDEIVKAVARCTETL